MLMEDPEGQALDLPVILIVAHDPLVRRAMERDLERQFASDYQVRSVDSGRAGLDVIRECALHGQPVAMLLADQPMPEMSGVAFLAEAARLAPRAKRVLLAAYDDTQAAISAINQVRLDYYLPRPTGSPDQSHYTALSDLLDDWHTTAPRLGSGIRVVGHRWSARSHEIKDYLARNLVPYEWMDVEAQEDAQHLLRSPAPTRPSFHWCSFPMARRWSSLTFRNSRNAWAFARTPNVASTISSSSVADRPDWRRQSTVPPKGSTRC